MQKLFCKNEDEATSGGRRNKRLKVVRVTEDTWSCHTVGRTLLYIAYITEINHYLMKSNYLFRQSNYFSLIGQLQILIDLLWKSETEVKK